MDKGYYCVKGIVAEVLENGVAIHNKNGQGLLLVVSIEHQQTLNVSQSTIKMDKGYYRIIM